MSTPDPDRTMRVESAPFSTPRPALQDAQFAPGAIIDGRYRVASLLGKGGMGEVYRADDVKLGQTVALKFLPARLARDPILLARLHDEVRLGRQVAHPNVCRIYDIGEHEGAHFVAMEYVDGEDLARLLRRIGRLAHDKAVDIARGIAAGLAAAHAKGIVHRDLKPANVMIDSHGDARITDFGLALSAHEEQGGEISGTPAYMAPEQLDGAPATVQSDLYALGLVMYELFTGRRAHNAQTLRDRVRDVTSEITTPSAHIRDLDPAVEKVILRCLANEPAQRPHSARQVIEALPGGDPLAAALAAGETPSPRIVAAAGSAGVLTRTAAWSLLLAIVTMTGMIAWARNANSLTGYGPMLAPEVLRDRAEAMLRMFGTPFNGTGIPSFHKYGNYTAWLYHRGSFEPMRHGPPWVVYRIEYGPTAQESTRMPRESAAPGWTAIEVDTKGRLASLLASPERDWTPATLDWNALLAAAGLDPRRLQPAAAQRIPAAPFDTLKAWTGTYPDDEIPVRIEAAAWRGRPVYFRVTGPWDNEGERDTPFNVRSVGVALMLLSLGIVVGGALLAWRNLRARRGDRQGALRAALLAFTLTFLGLLLTRPIGQGVQVILVGLEITAQALLLGAIVFLLYVALEPYVRRRWPATLIAWSRFVSGNWRDPMIGRDLLVGIAGGVLHTAIASVPDPLHERLGGPASGPHIDDITWLNGVPQTIGHVLLSSGIAFLQAFLAVVLLVMLAIMLRRRALAVGALAAMLLTAYFFATGGDPLLFFYASIVVGVTVTLMARFGLLALAVGQSSFIILHNVPGATGASWALPMMAVPAIVILALAVWGFRTALGDQSVLPALDE